MKKWTLLLSLCLLLTGCAQAYDGPVEQKRVLLTEEFVSHPHSDEEPISTHLWENAYDQHGNHIQRKYYNNGKADQLCKLRYDEAGNLLTSTTCEYLLGLPILWTGTDRYTYDAQGHVLTAEETRLRFWQNTTRSYTYEEGLITMVRTDWRGKVRYTIQTHLDEAGRPIREVNGNYEQRWVYDAAGNEILSEEWTDGERSFYQSRTYDDQNRCLTWTYTYSGGTVINRWTYDDTKGTATCHTSDGFRTEEQYTEFGELRYRAYYDRSGRLDREEYQTYGSIAVAGKENTP